MLEQGAKADMTTPPKVFSTMLIWLSEIAFLQRIVKSPPIKRDKPIVLAVSFVALMTTILLQRVSSSA